MTSSWLVFTSHVIIFKLSSQPKPLFFRRVWIVLHMVLKVLSRFSTYEGWHSTPNWADISLAIVANEPVLKVFEGLLPFTASLASRVSMVVCIGGSHPKCLVPTFSFPFDITTYENCIVRVAFNNYARNMNNKSNTHTTTLIDVHNKMKQLMEITMYCWKYFFLTISKSIVNALSLQKRKIQHILQS